jgi:glycerol kinase
MSILAIDAGTTGVTALIVDTSGRIKSRGYSEFEQHFAQPGWVEHEPEQIWQATLVAVRGALASSPLGEADARKAIAAVGITNQRETVVLWNRKNLKAARRAIVWQDRRSHEIVERLRVAGHESAIRAKTGLGLDPYFSSTKLSWIRENEPSVWAEVESGDVAIGTVESYLVARLTGGKLHITDASNASRTQLMNIHSGGWDSDLLELFGVPESALPKIVPNWGNFGQTDSDAFEGISAAICGMAGDQQAALFGQTAFAVGDSKCTYGTGAFLLYNTGDRAVESQNGLLTTIGWTAPNGETAYALEGSVFVAGATVQWLRDQLGFVAKSAEIEALASSVADTNGAIFVPALTGLGAPWWDSEVRGTLLGLTRGTSKAHLARAALESVALQVYDLADAMGKDVGSPLTRLRVDGGMSANNLLMQMQADVLGVAVERSSNPESTGLGAALMAGLGAGIFGSLAELQQLWQLDKRFEPQPYERAKVNRWHRAVAHARAWVN